VKKEKQKQKRLGLRLLARACVAGIAAAIALSIKS